MGKSKKQRKQGESSAAIRKDRGSRVLVFRNGAFGDILTTTPVLRGLKESYPDSEITYMAHKRFEELLHFLPHVDHVETVESFLPPHPEFDELSSDFDVAVNLTMAAEQAPYYGVWNKIDAFCDVAGVSPSSLVPEINMEREPANRRRIALQLEGSAAERCWPLEYCRRLSKILVADGYEILLLGDRDIGWEEDGVQNFAGRCSFMESVVLLSGCSALVGPDSAMYHFAAALDVPFVMILGTYNPAQLLKHYRKKAHRLAYSRMPCEPCFLTPRCGIQPERNEHRGLAHCMRSITAEMVREHVRDLLGSPSSKVARPARRPRSGADEGQATVVYLTPTLGCSGGIRTVFDHCNRLLERGHRVLVASEDGARDPRISTFRLDVPVVSLSEVAEVQPDIIVATGAGTAWAATGLALDCRLFYLVQGREPYFKQGVAYRQRAEATYRLPNLSLLTVSPALSEWLREEHGRESALIENGLDQGLFFPDPAFPREGRPRVLVEGPLTVPWKGMGDAFEILGQLEVEVWHLSTTATQHSGVDRLWCLPSQDTIRRIYSSCDVMLKTSHLEAGTPLPVMEAMACGCPCVVYDIPGVRQHCRHDENSLLVEPGNKSAAIEALLDLLSDTHLHKRIQEGGIATARARFGWSEKIDRLEEALKLRSLAAKTP